MVTRILGPVAAALVVAAAGLVAPSSASAAAAPPAAAACSTAEGVTAVVDFNQLGGVTAGCDPKGGGRAASQVFAAAGYSLSYSNAPGMQGFVCKVNGLPRDGDCAQSDRFWSLWWSKGTGDGWHFSNTGVGGMTVPNGGYVAFSWHEGGGSASPPSFTPAAHPEPTPTPPPPTGGGGGGGAGGGGGGTGDGTGGGSGAADGDDGAAAAGAPSGTATPSGSASASATTSASASKAAKAKRQKASASANPSESAEALGGEPVGSPADVGVDPDDGGPGWATWALAGGAAGVLALAAAVPIWRRRRQE